ncbi:Putative ATP-dependent RNA helicase A, partial [Durusdinium trenchii]
RNPRSCSMLLWSMASLRHDQTCELFYYHLADSVILPLAQEFQPQDISNCLWAFATARVEHQAVFRSLAQQAALKAPDLTSQALANATWACAKMRAEADQLVNVALSEALHRPMRTFSPQGLVTLCWSAAEVHVAPTQLLGHVTTELMSRPNAFNDLDLSTLVYALKEKIWINEDQHVRQAALLRVKAEASRRKLPATRKMLSVTGMLCDENV